MKRPLIHQRMIALTLTALAALPVGSALVAGPMPVEAASSKTAKTHSYKGSVVNTTWGPIQVSISTKSKRIIDVKAVAPAHTARSTVLDDRALPILRQEVLQAQSANINQVSGATTVSQAYVQSLQAAIDSARRAKSL